MLTNRHRTFQPTEESSESVATVSEPAIITVPTRRIHNHESTPSTSSTNSTIVLCASNTPPSTSAFQPTPTKATKLLLGSRRSSANTNSSYTASSPPLETPKRHGLAFVQKFLFFRQASPPTISGLAPERLNRPVPHRHYSPLHFFHGRPRDLARAKSVGW